MDTKKPLKKSELFLALATLSGLLVVAGLICYYLTGLAILIGLYGIMIYIFRGHEIGRSPRFHEY